MAQTLLALSKRCAINAAVSAPVHSPSNNVLFALVDNCANVAAMAQSGATTTETKNGWRDVLSVMARASVSLEMVASAKRSALSLLRELPDGGKLSLQFKSVFPRFYATLCTREMVESFIEELLSDAIPAELLPLLQLIADETPGAMMTAGIQLRLLAVYQSLLSATETPSVGKSRSSREAFVRVWGTMTNSCACWGRWEKPTGVTRMRLRTFPRGNRNRCGTSCCRWWTVRWTSWGVSVGGSAVT